MIRYDPSVRAYPRQSRRFGTLACALALAAGLSAAGPAPSAHGQAPRHAPLSDAAVIERLSDAQPAVRAEAAAVLGRRGAAGAVEAMLARLDAPEPEATVRTALYAALGRLGAADGWPALRTCLTDEPPPVRAACARALHGLADGTAGPAANQALLTLVEALETPAPVRAGAVAALAAYGSDETVAALDRLAGLSDAAMHGPIFRAPAIQALGTIGARTALPAPVRAGLRRVLNAPQPAARLAAVTALHRIGNTADAPALLRRADADLGALTEMTPTEMARRVGTIERLAATLAALADLDPTGAVASFLRLTEYRVPDGSAALRLASPAAAAALTRARRAALRGLGRSGVSERAGPALAGPHGLGHPDFRLRAVAAEAIGQLGRDDAARALLPALKDPAAEVRWTAARALGRVGNPAVAEPLVALFGDADSRVRAATATALADLGATGAIPVLERRATTEERPPARLAAEAALERLRQ